MSATRPEEESADCGASERDLQEVVCALEGELARLRGQNRLMKRVGVAAVVLALLGVGGAGWGIWRAEEALDPNRTVYAGTIEARRINLRDARGEARIRLYVTVDGPGLALRDENGCPRVALHATSSGPVVTVRSPSLEPLFHVP